jgi:hypothetical protein
MWRLLTCVRALRITWMLIMQMQLEKLLSCEWMKYLESFMHYYYYWSYSFLQVNKGKKRYMDVCNVCTLQHSFWSFFQSIYIFSGVYLVNYPYLSVCPDDTVLLETMINCQHFTGICFSENNVEFILKLYIIPHIEVVEPIIKA